jgi:hypothetical protein
LLVTHFRRFARRTLPWSKIEVFPVRSISLDIFEAMLAVVRAVRNGQSAFPLRGARAEL